MYTTFASVTVHNDGAAWVCLYIVYHALGTVQSSCVDKVLMLFT